MYQGGNTIRHFVLIEIWRKSMERVVNFGKLSFDQQLKTLQEEMNTKDILLFQYYERNLDIIESQDQIDEYFENYCEDVIYYYNPELQKEIEQAILKEMMRSVELSGKVSDIEKEEQAKILYKKMKNEYVNFSLKNIDSIKKIIPELFTTLPRMWLKAT